MGTIFIRELPVHCIIGVHAHERASRQRILVSVELSTDFTAAAASDRLEDAVDYSAIADLIQQQASDGRFQLLEALAESLLEALLVEPVSRVTIEIQKPGALAATRQVGVRVERARSEQEGKG